MKEPEKDYVEILRKLKAAESAKKWRENNPDKVKEGMRKWQSANPDKVKSYARKWRKANPEKIKEYVRRWQKANPERTKELAKKWQAANPERMKANIKRWQEANPDKLREYANKRYAKIKEVGTHTPDEALEVFLNQKGLCALCGCEMKLGVREKDHIVPISKGGSNLIANIQWLCRPCNRRKHASI